MFSSSKQAVDVVPQPEARSTDAGIGVGEIGWSWLIYLAVLGPALVTYSRLPPLSTYHFNATGFVDGGLSRMVTELNYPIAMAAIPLAAISYARLGGRRAAIFASLAVALCLVAFVPGVVSVADLTARWVNAFAVVGCVIALGLSALALRAYGGALAPGHTGWDVLRLVLGIAFAVWSVPWLFAAFGTYVSDAPLLGDIYRAHEPTPGEPDLASVHMGLHEGLAGTQMALTALLLSRTLRRLGSYPRLRTTTSAYLCLLFCYGSIVSLNDGWNEQLVKRGVVDFQLPYLLTPKVEVGWGVLLVAAAAVHLLWFRREYRAEPAGPVAVPGTHDQISLEHA